jgi:hypothetical protein
MSAGSVWLAKKRAFSLIVVFAEVLVAVIYRGDPGIGI